MTQALLAHSNHPVGEHSDMLEVLPALPATQADQLYQDLIEQMPWQQEYFAFGRAFPVPRRQCWIADEGVHYRVANNFLHSHPWNPLLMPLREQIETISGQAFNAVLLTWYRDGQDSVNWHRDNEPELGTQPYIVSLSLGATRQFSYRHLASQQEYSLDLNHGDLYLMHPRFQRDYEHAVFAEPQVNAGRINLTFRHVSQTRETPEQ